MAGKLNNGTATNNPEFRESTAYCEGRRANAEQIAHVYATGTTGVVQDDNAITWTSAVVGDGVQVVLADPGDADQNLAVSVSGNVVTVSLATDQAGDITSTGDQVKAGVAGDQTAAALVAGADTSTSDGSGVVVAETCFCTGSNCGHPANSVDAVIWKAGYDSYDADPSGLETQDCCADLYGDDYGG